MVVYGDVNSSTDHDSLKGKNRAEIEELLELPGAYIRFLQKSI